MNDKTQLSYIGDASPLTRRISGASGQTTRGKSRAALDSVLRLYADPLRLKVRSALKAGGIEYRNHSRRLLVVS